MGNDNREGGGGFFAGFLVGAVVGGGLAVLLAQEETRDMLLGKVREAGNYAMDASGDVRGKVGDATAQWQSGAGDLYERGRQVVESARSNINSAVQDGIAQADRLREELQKRGDV